LLYFHRCQEIYKNFFTENGIDEEDWKKLQEICGRKHVKPESKEGFSLMAKFLLDKVSDEKLLMLVIHLDAELKQSDIVVPIVRETPFSRQELIRLLKGSKYELRPDFKVAAQGELAFCNMSNEDQHHYITFIAPSVTQCECIILKDANTDSFWMLHVEPQGMANFINQTANVVQALEQEDSLKNIIVDAIFINANTAHQSTIDALLKKGVKIRSSQHVGCENGGKDIFFSPKDGRINIFYNGTDDYWQTEETKLYASTAFSKQLNQ